MTPSASPYVSRTIEEADHHGLFGLHRLCLCLSVSTGGSTKDLKPGVGAGRLAGMHA